ncbi:MAG: GTP-binding protein [Aquificaceae bacterium]
MNLRILYHGLGMAGKTTNLEKLKEAYLNYVQDRIHQQTTEGRTVYLDILSLNIKTRWEDREVRVEIFTTPGQERFRPLRKWLFGYVNSVVFVLDSGRSLEENLSSYKDLEEVGLIGVPMVLQANKRDLEGALSLDSIRSHFKNLKTIEAVAKDGIGVVETFREILREVLNAKAPIG